MARNSKSKSDNGVKGVSSSAGNTSPGREDYVRQVSPDRHPATVRNREKLKIGTWNVQTMLQTGKLENVKQEMKRMKINILGLAEMRWKGAGHITSDGFTILYSGGDKHYAGVGLMLDPDTAKAIKGYWTVSDRVILVKLQGTPFDIGIIQAYAPTADKDEEEMDAFYETIEKAMKQLKSQDVGIILGDFNSKVGGERIETTIGPFGIGEKNDRGDRLIEWCKQHNLAAMNTWFKNHPRRCWTWKSPGDRTRNQIDYILVQERHRNSMTSCKSMPGADCGSDHIPVVGTLRIKLKKLKKPKTSPKLQLNLLEKDEIMRESYTVSVKNKFSALEGLTTAEERWQSMKESILESASEHIPTAKRKEDKKWINSDILKLMDERRKAKGNEIKYRELDKRVKKQCIEAKESWINSQCKEIEDKATMDSKTMHQKIRELSGKKSSARTSCLRANDGNILMEKEDILHRWSEYIEELYQDNRGPPPTIINEDEGLPILEDEVRIALKKMKSGKASGPDEIPSELITALGEIGVEEVTKLLNSIYDTGKIPDDFKKSVYIALPKKPGTVECDQHRTISLMSHLTKVLLRVLMNRMRDKIMPEISETQFGFMADKGTRNAIFALRILMERAVEVQTDLYLCFIDYSKAFDKVRHSALFDILQGLNVDGKDLRILRNLYWEQEAAIRVDNECSEYRPIRRGVRQGCVFSPDLFNIYSEMILRNIEQHEGVKVGGKNINNLRYADDTVLIADSEEKLQRILQTVTEESENKGLQLNAKKTECMVISKKPTTPTCNLTCKGEEIKQVNTFKYLGCTKTPDAKCDSEIKKRIAMAKETFTKMKSIFTNRNIKLATKINALKAYVWSVLLYGCECWTLTPDLEKRLEAAELWFIRRIMKISWTEKKTNEEVMGLAGYRRALMKTIRRRQLEFFGHINRADRLEKQLLCGKICGKRSRGRQRTKYTDSLNNFATGKKSHVNELIRKTDNREEWRAMIAYVCNRPGT